MHCDEFGQIFMTQKELENHEITHDKLVIKQINLVQLKYANLCIDIKKKQFEKK